MSSQKGWSRRNFVRLMGSATFCSRGFSSSLLPFPGSTRASFAYVGCADGGADAIEAFAIRDGRWTRIQRVESKRPVALALDSKKCFLYAANEVAEYRGLPVGTVESFAVGSDGMLTRVNRQGLSLSATMPRHLSISQDGMSLIVAANGGGAYNVLPIAADGSVGRASGILKETGVGASKTAQPRMAVFDRAGRVVSADEGTGRLSVLAMNNDGLAAHTRNDEAKGSGPRHIVLHPDGKTLYVAHEDSLQCYSYDSDSGQILELRQHLAGAGVADGSNALAVHPSGDLLFACDRENGVTAWRVDGSGKLRFAGKHAEVMGQLHAIELSGDGTELLAINRERGRVSGAMVDRATGRVSGTRALARVDSPKSIAVV